MRISDWSSDVCSSDLDLARFVDHLDAHAHVAERPVVAAAVGQPAPLRVGLGEPGQRVLDACARSLFGDEAAAEREALQLLHLRGQGERAPHPRHPPRQPQTRRAAWWEKVGQYGEYL